MNGSSVTMIASLPCAIGSTCARAAHAHTAAAGLVGVADPLAAEDDAAGREVGALDVLHQPSTSIVRVVDVGDDARRSTSRRLCGGMFVAMPTAMPDEPLTSRFGKRAGRTSGSCRGRRSWARSRRCPRRGRAASRWPCATGAPRCSAWPPAGRRRSSRSCPGRRRAGSASRSPAPCGRACRRSPRRRAGGSCPSRRRRSRAHLRYGRVRLEAELVHRVEHAAVHGLEAVADVGQRAPDDHAHGVVEVRRAHLLLERRAARCCRR